MRLDKKYLQVHYKGVGTEDIVYTILASDGRPKYGTASPEPPRVWVTLCFDPRLSRLSR